MNLCLRIIVKHMIILVFIIGFTSAWRENIYKSLVTKRAINRQKFRKPCEIFVGDNLINLENLKSTSGYEVNQEGRKFLLNICGPVPTCGSDVSACEVNPRTREVKILGYNDTLTILTSYKPIPGLKYQTRGKKKLRVEIEFKCNRRLNTPDIKYIPPQEVGRRYKFLFETKMVCSEHKMNCVIRNIHENSQIDLRSLHKQSGNWQIQNTKENIYLNLCGPLNPVPTDRNKECAGNMTQVCWIGRRGQSKNLGTASSDFLADNNNLSVTFKDGSSCGGNNYTETQIDFFCSHHEQHPKLLSSSTCKYHITWHTPAACPHHVESGHKCEIYSTFFGMRDMKTIFPDEDTAKQISNKVTIRYNICYSLFEPCGYYNNASVCLVNDGNYIVLGWTNDTVTSKNRQMSMNLEGESCPFGGRTSTDIILLCNETNSRENDIQLSIDMCKLTLKVYTHLACPETEKYNCTAVKKSESGSVVEKYNLAPLINDKTNYEIRDTHDSNVVYILNVCRPVVFSNNTVCDRYSGVCRRNSSEPNIIKKFKSLGNVNFSPPSLENGNLVIRYDHGSICHLQNVTHSSVFSEIRFVCSHPSRESYPTLVSKDGCHYKFIWKTRHACKI